MFPSRPNIESMRTLWTERPNSISQLHRLSSLSAAGEQREAATFRARVRESPTWAIYPVHRHDHRTEVIVFSPAEVGRVSHVFIGGVHRLRTRTKPFCLELLFLSLHPLKKFSPISPPPRTPHAFGSGSSRVRLKYNAIDTD